MSAEEFWCGPPRLAAAYRKAEEYREKRANAEAWRMGLYMQSALQSTVGNMFRKKGAKPVEYLEEPLPLTVQEAEEREIRKAAEAEERLREKMMAKVRGG